MALLHQLVGKAQAFCRQILVGQRQLAFARHFIGGKRGGSDRRGALAQHEHDIVHHVGELGIVLDPAVRDIGQADQIGARFGRAHEPADPTGQFGQVRGHGIAGDAMAAAAILDIVDPCLIRIGHHTVGIGDGRGGMDAAPSQDQHRCRRNSAQHRSRFDTRSHFSCKSHDLPQAAPTITAVEQWYSMLLVPKHQMMSLLSCCV